ncbi:hypothetical protein QC761_0037150 [Podospora bellae-mahoneyi]|uniref:Uncharacterized protein n=1 Tax=Podospora bellae-mahoneyi TaxID=2093777 RepID=A0ABR0FPH9_9PEZI|nr:hypothetical protein QC761_0037150 [Podospora bellae-mahoneyi]
MLCVSEPVLITLSPKEQAATADRRCQLRLSKTGAVINHDVSVVDQPDKLSTATETSIPDLINRQNRQTLAA